MRSRVLFFFSVLSVLVVMPSMARASNFEIMPLKLILDSKSKSAVVKVTNNADEKISIQVEAVEWDEDQDGKSKYTETKEIIFFPKIFTIPPKDEKSLRVSFKGEWPKGEKAYRLLLSEIPRTGVSGIQMVLRLSMPVFARGDKKPAEKVMQLGGLKISGANLLVNVKNAGPNHFTVTKIKVQGLDGSGAETFSREVPGWYVLAGHSRDFPVELKSAECARTKTIKVTVPDDKASLEGSAEVTAEAVEKMVAAEKAAQEARETEKQDKDEDEPSDE